MKTNYFCMVLAALMSFSLKESAGFISGMLF